MKRFAFAGSIALALSALGAMPSFAAMRMNHVTLHVAQPYVHNMRFAHVMAGATLTYTKHDITIKLAADNLPAPGVLHEKVYVLWATNGMHRQNLGALKTTGMMAGLTAMTMMVKTQDLVVTAEQSAMVSKPMGPTILSAMI